MVEKEEYISLEEARKQVALVCRRLGLLHLAFSEVLVKEFGKEEGKRLIAKAIKEYGKKIGERKREIALSQGLELTPENFQALRDIPTIGMHDHSERVEVAGEKRSRAYGCVMAQVWHEYNQDELGRIYCYVDPANVMAFSPEFKLAHTKTVPDGDEFCELVMRPTTEQDREDFLAEDTDWTELDK